ncbi:MAG: YncE family protein, partial [Ferrimicrobium sp.]
LAVNPTTDTVYATNGHSISVISGKTDRVVRSIRMRYNVVGLAVNPTTDTVYAATYEDSYATYLGQAPESTLSVINGATDKVTHTVDLNSQVLALAVNPTTDTVYAADDTVSVMNGATGKVTHTIHGDPGSPSFFFNLAVNPTTDTVYATNGHSISVISGKTDRVTHTILAKSGGLAVNPTTDTVYATNRNSVSVIALATGSQTSDSRVIIGLAAVGLVIVVGGATLLVALERRRAA